MNHLRRFQQKIAIYTYMAIFLPGAVAVASFIFLEHFFDAGFLISLLGTAISFAICIVLGQITLITISLRPIEMLWQAIWHVSPEKSKTPAPNLTSLKIGRELISTMVMQIYELASLRNSDSSAIDHESVQTKILENIPLPMIILNKELNVEAINESACQYLGTLKQDALGKNVNDILHLSFTDNDTLNAWLENVQKNRATDTKIWNYVKMSLADKHTKKLDLAVSYSKDNSLGHEVVIALFDRNSEYSVQEQATSYVALAVHELRTPLTMLRGYIELFEEELGEQLNAEHKEFMRKMSASAQNLTAFVNNILNVARIDEDQFPLTLQEADWGSVLSEIVESLRMRAEVRGKNISLSIEPNMPTAAIDKISMYEVVTNLIENAIKYSGQSSDIVVKTALSKSGSIETTVTDYGDGIPQSVIGNLFTKFYRSHRSKNAIGGSGLGLYLVKAIITAHGGDVWVKSKEGEGSTFGFSLVPYKQISKDNKVMNKDGIERQASGWIKNHSLYRR